ncbi:MAG: ROK family protein [Corynebacterium sp.]|nr:ROK family protein [Corynebacterium sp.]
MTKQEAYVAIDIGGTKIAAGFSTPGFPEIFARSIRRTPEENVLDAVIAAVHETVTAAREGGYEPISIGIGAPGVIDAQQGQVVAAGPTMPGWAGTSIAAEVVGATGLPVAVHNDVRLMGLGEARFGSAQDYDRILFVSLGTGVGGALIYAGHLQEGAHATAGELRSIVAADIHGQASVLEDVLSGPGIAASYNAERDMQGRGDGCATGNTADLGLRAIMQRYHAGEELARCVVHDSCFVGGKALGGFASAIDVDAIIVGGGVGTIGPEIIAPLTKGIHAGALASMKQVPVRVASLGTAAPLFGAAWYGVEFGHQNYNETLGLRSC